MHMAFQYEMDITSSCFYAAISKNWPKIMWKPVYVPMDAHTLIRLLRAVDVPVSH